MIGPDGTVKKSRVLGGHPVLAMDAQRAAEKLPLRGARQRQPK
jgi:hypothetical protein